MNNNFQELEKQIRRYREKADGALREFFTEEREISNAFLLVTSAILGFLAFKQHKNLFDYLSIISLITVLLISIKTLFYRRENYRNYFNKLSLVAQQAEKIQEALTKGATPSDLSLPSTEDLRKQREKIDKYFKWTYGLFVAGLILMVLSSFLYELIKMLRNSK